MLIGGFSLYNGATITRAIDGAGAEYIACCAKRTSDGLFGFWIFRNGVPVPLTPFCDARGSISADGHWIAFNETTIQTGAIPGFVPVVAAPDPRLKGFLDGLTAAFKALLGLK